MRKDELWQRVIATNEEDEKKAACEWRIEEKKERSRCGRERWRGEEKKERRRGTLSLSLSLSLSSIRSCARERDGALIWKERGVKQKKETKIVNKKKQKLNNIKKN